MQLSKLDNGITELEGLKSIPDFAAEPEMVENTPLNADSKRYEIGVKDFGSLENIFLATFVLIMILIFKHG